jgi:SAM-dependent methyltransferase
MQAVLRHGAAATRVDRQAALGQAWVMSDPDLHAALSLAGPDACLALYKAWAASYDSGFAKDMTYLLPAHVAAAFVSAGGQGPVLDVGAGTGLLAQSLQDMGFDAPIDAADFSPDMLLRAGEKGIYRALYQADITQPIAIDPVYRGIVSSGTFTAGHVGPEALPNLLALALPGAQFALSINLRVWADAGFDTAISALQAAGKISALQLIEVQVYGPSASAIDQSHAEDRARVVLFHKV